MSLIDCMMESCVFMVKEQAPDGSGGSDTVWVEGEPLNAAFTLDTSTEAQIADASGTVKEYTVSVSRSVRLEYHAVIKRLSDGKTFRITSDSADKKTPVCTALDIAQATAEAWRLTT
jgi:hypothetical protein